MLSFFEAYLAYHRKLNPKLFEEGKLRPEVRDILLKNAETWVRFAKIPGNTIEDIIFTGGNAQYNYTRYSDLDVHIIIDKTIMTKIVGKTLIDDYLKDKKTLWSMTRHITVRGYPVEMYAQDITDHLVAAGVYSLMRDAWITEPVRGHYDFAHDDVLNSKVREFIDRIDGMIRDRFPRIEFYELKDKLKTMRKAALASGDEFSFDNLYFKSLRNSGVLDRMNTYLQGLRDQDLSLI